MEYNNPIVKKSYSLALDIVDLYRYLTINKKEYILSKQLVRSGTSVGANVKEGIKGFSNSDFKYKMSIALKEANETEFWLELLIDSKYINDYRKSKIALEKCKEICKILNSIVWNSNKR